MSREIQKIRVVEEYQEFTQFPRHVEDQRVEGRSGEECFRMIDERNCCMHVSENHWHTPITLHTIRLKLVSQCQVASPGVLPRFHFPRTHDGNFEQPDENKRYQVSTDRRQTSITMLLRQKYQPLARGARLFLPILGAVFTFAPLPPPTRPFHFQHHVNYSLSSGRPMENRSSVSCTVDTD